MSAMHAMALPEDDPDSQAAAICRYHGRTMRSLPAPGQAASARAASIRAASSQAARAQARRNQAAAAAPLRLTRRGRVVIAAAAALLVLVVSLIAAGAAQATSHSVPPRVAGQNLSRMTVRPGQTLWSVAESADPDADTRLVVQQIVDLNSLTSDVVLVGQRLWVPRGLTRPHPRPAARARHTRAAPLATPAPRRAVGHAPAAPHVPSAAAAARRRVAQNYAAAGDCDSALVSTCQRCPRRLA